MATYPNSLNTIKETVVVDYKNRATMQQVKLLNEGNIYAGTFCGKIQSENGSVLEGVTLKNPTIEGGTINGDITWSGIENITAYTQTLNNLNSRLSELTTDLNQLQQKLDTNKDDLNDWKNQTYQPKINEIAGALASLQSTINSKQAELQALYEQHKTSLNTLLEAGFEGKANELDHKLDALSEELKALIDNVANQIDDVKPSDVQDALTAFEVRQNQKYDQLAGDLGLSAEILENKINGLSSSTDGKIDEISSNLTTALNNSARVINDKIESNFTTLQTADATLALEFTTNLNRQIDSISGTVDAKFASISGTIDDKIDDVYAQIQETHDQFSQSAEELDAKIDNSKAELEAADAQIKSDLTQLEQNFATSQETQNKYLLDVIENKRHYTIKADNGIMTRPYQADDMTMNIFAEALPTAIAKTTIAGNKLIDIGSITTTNGGYPVNFTPYRNISDDSAKRAFPIALSFDSNGQMLDKSNECGYSYQIQYLEGDPLSMCQINAVPSYDKIYPIVDSQNQNIGFLANVVVDDATQRITSALLKLNYLPEYAVFKNTFDGQTLNASNQLTLENAEKGISIEISQQLDATNGGRLVKSIIFKSGIRTLHYIGLKDTESNLPFGKIYVPDGLNKVESTNELTSIEVQLEPSTDYVLDTNTCVLKKNQGWEQILARNIAASNDGKNYDLVLKADVTDDFFEINLGKRALGYKYSFYSTLTQTGEKEAYGYVIPLIYNEALKIDSNVQKFVVSLEELQCAAVLPENSKIVTLTRNARDYNLWTLPNADQQIQDINGNFIYIEIRRDAQSKKYQLEVRNIGKDAQSTISRRYDIDYDAFTGTEETWYNIGKTNEIPVVDQDTDTEDIADSIKVVNLENETLSPLKTYTAIVDDSQSGVVEVQIPKKPEDSTYSREFMLGFNLNSPDVDEVIVRFIPENKDEYPEFIGATDSEGILHVKTNGLRLFQVNEYQDSKFFVEDVGNIQDQTEIKDLTQRLELSAIKHDADAAYISSTFDESTTAIQSQIADISAELISAELSTMMLSAEYCMTKADVETISEDVQSLSAWTDESFVKLSGGSSVDGLTEFNQISVAGLSADSLDAASLNVSFENVLNSDGGSLAEVIAMLSTINDDQTLSIEIADSMISELSAHQANAVEYQGDLNAYDPFVKDEPGDKEYSSRLSAFFNNTINDENAVLKRGYLYHLTSEMAVHESDDSRYVFEPKDFILIKNNVQVKDITLTDIEIIRDAEDECLALSAEAFSTINALSAETNEKFTEAYAALITISSDLSDSISTLSTRTDNRFAETIQTIDNISSELSLKILAVADELSDGIEALSADVYDEFNSTSAFINSMSAELAAQDEALSNSIVDLSAYADNRFAKTIQTIESISSELASEIDDSGAEISSQLTGIVTVQLENVVPTLSTLSVINVTNDEYNELAYNSLTSGIELSALYVIKDTYIDAREQLIKNVARPTVSADAATKGYVDDAKLELYNSIDEVESTINENIDAVNNVVTTRIDELEDELNISTTSLAQEIQAVSAELSDEFAAANQAIMNKMAEISTSLETADQAIINEMTDISTTLAESDSDISSHLTGIVTVQLENDVPTLSTLSVINVTNAEFNEIAYNAITSDVDLSGLYVIRDTYIDAREQLIKNVGTPTASADAATKGYVDIASSNSTQRDNELAAAIDSHEEQINDLNSKFTASGALILTDEATNDKYQVKIVNGSIKIEKI